MIDPTKIKAAYDHERVVTPSHRVLVRGAYNPHQAAYQTADGLAAIASVDEEGHGVLYHVSVSRKKHVPNWTEMLDVWKAFRIDSPMMILPTWTKHKSVHDHCLHYYSVPSQWHDYVATSVSSASLVRRIETAPAKPYAPVRLMDLNGGRPTYRAIKAYRDMWYPISQDVLVWFDIHQRAYTYSVFLMLTPEPWQAGGAV
jgi:hypothetical protein